MSSPFLADFRAFLTAFGRRVNFAWFTAGALGVGKISCKPLPVRWAHRKFHANHA